MAIISLQQMKILVLYFLKSQQQKYILLKSNVKMKCYINVTYLTIMKTDGHNVLQ